MVPSLRRRRVRVSAWGLMTCSSHVTASPLAPSSQAVSLVRGSPVGASRCRAAAGVRRRGGRWAAPRPSRGATVSVGSDRRRGGPALAAAQASGGWLWSAGGPAVCSAWLALLPGVLLLLVADA